MSEAKKTRLESVKAHITTAFEAARQKPSVPAAPPKPQLKPNPRLSMHRKLSAAAPAQLSLHEQAQTLVAKAAATVSGKPTRHIHGDTALVIKAPTQSLEEILKACCDSVDAVTGDSKRRDAE